MRPVHDSAVLANATRREWIGLAVIALPCLICPTHLWVDPGGA